MAPAAGKINLRIAPVVIASQVNTMRVTGMYIDTADPQVYRADILSP